MNERRGYKLKLGIKDAKQLKVMRKAYFQLPAPSPWNNLSLLIICQTDAEEHSQEAVW